MKRFALVFAAWLTLVAQSLAGITYSGTTAQTLYARVQTGASTFVAAAMTEGSSGGLGIYNVSDASLVSAGLNSASTGSGFEYTIRSGSASTTANDTIVAYGVIAWTGSAELFRLPNAAPDTAGGLRTSLQGPVTWYVQSTGNDSNSGLSRTSPLATIAQAITNYRHGDTIWLIGANTTTGIAPIKWFILDGDRNASLTSTTAGANITLGSGANGSIIRHVAITNSGGSVGDDFGTITITNATNITIEDVPNVTNTNGFYGIKIGDSSFAASNVVLRGVTATGKYRGLGIIDSFVRSTNGNYSGTESGIYMDANNGDCWLYSDSDRGTGSTAAATSVTGPTYHTTAGLFGPGWLAHWRSSDWPEHRRHSDS
jgi:hypothetical protein